MDRNRATDMTITAGAIAGIEEAEGPEPAQPSGQAPPPAVIAPGNVLPATPAAPTAIEVDPKLIPQVERITRRSLDVVEAILRKDPNAVDVKELSILKDTAMGWINTRVKLKAAEIQSQRPPDRLGALLIELRQLAAAEAQATPSD